MKKKPKTLSKMKKLLKQSKTIRKKIKQRIVQLQSSTLRLRTESKQILELIRVQTFTENLHSQNRIKALLASKGVKAQKLFWNLVNRKPKKKKTFEALETSDGLTSNRDMMNKEIESFFEVKFNTSFNPADIKRESVNLEELGTPARVFSTENSDNMMRPLTMEELVININELNTSKAEGPDGITNSMLKHTGVRARNHLLEMLNNVIIGG